MINIIFRTDLALEAGESIKKIEGVESSNKRISDISVSEIKIKTKDAAKKLNKSIGSYITVETPPFTDDTKSMEYIIKIIANELKKNLPNKGLVLVIGIGNLEITPDALGPKSADNILATRHITGEIAKTTGLEKLRPVAVLSPGVLGQTGIEVSELISSLSKKIDPSCVILIDALASRSVSRLGCTVQISNTGISPGSGVKNSRPLIDESTIGVPVISLGVPTVVDATTLATDIFFINNEREIDKFKEKIKPEVNSMMVTPREIDLLIERSSKIIGMAVNLALHPDFSLDDISMLVS